MQPGELGRPAGTVDPRPIPPSPPVFVQSQPIYAPSADNLTTQIQGTGKTFTMEGFKRGASAEDRGIIPRAIEQVFAHIQRNASPRWVGGGGARGRSMLFLVLMCGVLPYHYGGVADISAVQTDTHTYVAASAFRGVGLYLQAR